MTRWLLRLFASRHIRVRRDGGQVSVTLRDAQVRYGQWPDVRGQ